MVGRMAYVWGWPLVNSHNRRAAFAEAPEPGLMGGVLPIAPVGQYAMLTNYINLDIRSRIATGRPHSTMERSGLGQTRPKTQRPR